MICRFPRTISLGLIVAQFAARAAEVAISVSTVELIPARIAINVGDTVVWTGRGPVGLDANSIVSYTGEWASPPLFDTSPPFKFTFEQPGFYAYRSIALSGFPPYEPRQLVNNSIHRIGTITVLPWSNAPPNVTINAPIEGARLSWRGGNELTPVLASVDEHFGEVDRVEFFLGTNLVAVTTNAPYSLFTLDLTPGTKRLFAKAVNKEGQTAWSPPVTFSVEEANEPKLFAPSIQREYLFVFDYLNAPVSGTGIYGVDRLGVGYGREHLEVRLFQSGTFVENIRSNQMRFFFWAEAQ